VDTVLFGSGLGCALHWLADEVNFLGEFHTDKNGKDEPFIPF